MWEDKGQRGMTSSQQLAGQTAKTLEGHGGGTDIVPLSQDADNSKLTTTKQRSECQTMWLKDLGSPEDSDLTV